MPPFLRRFILSLIEKIGLRLLPLSQARRGTDPFLYQSVLAAWRSANPGVPPVMLDVGANVGDVSAALHAAFPDAVIHAFEPSPAVYAQLEPRFTTTPAVRCHRQAVGAAVGTLPFQTRADEPQLGRLAETASADTVDVPVTTVDAFLRQESLPGIALLKTDTEGFELDVLKGAAESLSAGRVQSILVETCPMTGSRRHVPLPALMDLLFPLGFRLHGLYDLGYSTDARLRFCNALFIRA